MTRRFEDIPEHIMDVVFRPIICLALLSVPVNIVNQIWLWVRR